MGKARCRALTHLSFSHGGIKIVVEMGKARCRALTPVILAFTLLLFKTVEMGKARCRALTHALPKRCMNAHKW